MRKSFTPAAVAALLLAVSGCGDSDDAEPADGGGSAVNRELAEEGLDFDSSTMDAMSIDVVAGGTPPAADPATADAGIDMLASSTAPAPNESGTAPADENAATNDAAVTDSE